MSTRTDSFDAGREARQLWQRCAPYWERERDIVRRYLDGPRSAQSDIRWLSLAAYKETRLYRELSPPQRRSFDAGTAVAGLDEQALLVLREEMDHYRAIAGLVDALGGRPPRPDEVLDFPADARLQRRRASLRGSGDALDRCASALVEGGGGAIYRELAGLGGNPFDERLAAVFAGILEDELDHGPGHLPQLAALLATPADVTRVGTILDELGTLRVRMREEMFAST